MCTGSHPFIPAPTAVKVELRCQQDEQRIENVFWVDVDETPTLTDCTTVSNLFSTWWETNLQPIISSTVLGTEIVATGWDNPEGAYFTNTTINGIAGHLGEAPIPNATSIAIHWSTAQRGRSNQGHVMHMGLVVSQVAGNDLLPAMEPVLISAYSALITAISAAGFFLSVASFCHDKVWRTEADMTPITSVTLRDTLLDQIIRRKPGHGR